MNASTRGMVFWLPVLLVAVSSGIPERPAGAQPAGGADAPREAPVKSDVVAVIRRELRSSTDVALYYRAEGGRICALAVTRTRAGTADFPGTTRQWDARVDRFRLLLREPGFGRTAVAGARALFRGLVEPLLTSVGSPHVTRLVVIPDGALQRLPFSALAPPDHPQKTWLGFVAPITYYPSVKALAAAGRGVTPGAAARILAVASRPDGEAAAEALGAAERGGRGSRALIGADATADGLEAAIRSVKPDVLHLATPVHPPPLDGTAGSSEHPGIALANEGQLDFGRLQDAGIEAALVIAPRTGSAAEDRLLAVGRPFLAAGASTVLGARWRVEDRILEKFLDRYYRHLADGLDLGRALVETRREFSRSPGFGGPATWAAFDLLGDDGRTLLVREPFRWYSFWWTVALVSTLVAGFRIVRVLARMAAERETSAPAA